MITQIIRKQFFCLFVSLRFFFSGGGGVVVFVCWGARSGVALV